MEEDKEIENKQTRRVKAKRIKKRNVFNKMNT